MQTPPTAKEIQAAAGKKGIDAILYPDLREQGKREYQKQLSECKNYTCNSLSKENEIEAASQRARACHAQRIRVRTIFEQAIGRVKGTIQKMDRGVPLRPMLEKILKELEASKKGHDTAIDEVKNAFVKCEEKLRKLGR